MINKTPWNKWIDVFKSNEKTPHGTFTNAQLDEVVSTFDAKRQGVPLVLGHADPQTPPYTAPAFGWVTGVRRAGDKLQAFVPEAVAEFTAAVAGGLWPRRSIRIGRRFDDGRLELRHVGFLGAAIPAVPGLDPIEFAGDPGVILEFDFTQEVSVKTIEQLEAELAAREAELAAEKAKVQDFAAQAARSQIASRKAAAKQSVDALVAEKKLPPSMADGLGDFLFALDDRDVMDFAAAGGTVKKQTPRAFMDGFLGSLGDQFKGLFKALPAEEKKKAASGKRDFALPADAAGETLDFALDEKAEAYAKEHKVSYAAALDRVMREQEAGR